MYHGSKPSYIVCANSQSISERKEWASFGVVDINNSNNGNLLAR